MLRRSPSRLRRTGAALAVAATCAALLTSASATGATPDAGTLTTSSGPVTWTGGPFVVPNPTGTAGAIDCTAPGSCDDFALTVSTPAGYGDAHQLRIEVGWPVTTADFDVYLLDASGATVASSASSADPETVVTAPTSGTYTVRVVPFAPIGQSYSATASLVDKVDATPPTSDAPTPRMTAYGAPEALGDAHNAGEPSIGVNDATNAAFYQSSLSTYRVAFDDSTSPATASWTDVSANALNGCPQGSTTSLDPILYVDHTTGRVFESQLSGADSLSCYSDDDGATWSPSQGGGIPSGVDHQTLGGGPFAADDPLNTANLYDRAVYYCSQDIATAFCALSRDGGVTFGAGVPVYNLLDCGGLHGHVAVAPDGSAYVPNKSCNGAQGLTTSSDDGKTWTVHTVPGSIPGDSDPAVAVGANGTVYYAYANGDGTQHVAVSRDHGATWTDDFNVGAALGIKNVVFPTAVAGDDDRAAISFIGTRAAGNYQDIDNFHGLWHLYTAYTYDGGKSWVTVSDTGSDPVQRGSICTSGTTCGDDRNLLDFIGSTVDNHGRVEVAFADGCTGACVTGDTTRDAYASIARQSTGLTLYSAFDPKPNLQVRNLRARESAGGVLTVTANLVNVGNAVASRARTLIRVEKSFRYLSGTVQLAPNSSVVVTTQWSVQGLTGPHPVTVVADPQNKIAESNESDNKAQKIVTFH